MSKPRRIGNTLLQKGLITEDQLTIALAEQQPRKKPLGTVLVELGFLREADLRDTLAETLGQPSINLLTLVPDHQAIALVPLETAKRYRVFPVSYRSESRRLLIAMADTWDVLALDQIAAALGGHFILEPLLAGENEIALAIDQFYGHELSIDGILAEIATGQLDQESLIAGNKEYSHPLVRLVDAIIADAVKQGASDIHFEPEQHFMRIRYRIDGVLRPVRSLHGSYWGAVAVRLKIMASLNIAESRAPQDGRIALSISGRAIDLRVAVLPTLHGENIVLRILDRNQGILPLNKLGLSDNALATIRFMVARPEGIILLTGPTGSGKTTSLYSILGAINTEQINIMTLEDPVEYPVMGLRQCSVNDAVKLSFANGIRAMMRQDPDVILVGEIRDRETAEMALRAAMTGHQVYATLHTNSALGAIPRLLDMGLKPEILAGNIIGVVAQRLVRKLCIHCREAYAASDFEQRLVGEEAQSSGIVLWKAKGCALCNNYGFKGRMAVIEVVRFDASFDELLARRATNREFVTAASQRGFQTLADEGTRLALEGVTSLEEVSRVVDLTSRAL